MSFREKKGRYNNITYEGLKRRETKRAWPDSLAERPRSDKICFLELRREHVRLGSQVEKR